MMALFIYAIAVNLIGFLLFARDKYCAQNQLWRVKEKTLLSTALFGGTVGVWIGQKVMRHKTRKEPFRSRLIRITGAQLVFLIAISVPAIREEIWNAVHTILTT